MIVGRGKGPAQRKENLTIHALDAIAITNSDALGVGDPD